MRIKTIGLLAFLLLVAPHVWAGHYIFFLHNRFFEEVGATGTSEDYGAASYPDLVKALSRDGFTVISELRKKNTDVKGYAQKVVKQVDSLIKTGVKPGEITVVGASKGAYITMHTSAMLKNKAVNFVLIGICNDDIMASNKNLVLYGNVLSIYERSDGFGQSCLELQKRSARHIKHYKEIALNNGLKHGYLYRPLPEWVDPVLQWASGNYR